MKSLKNLKNIKIHMSGTSAFFSLATYVFICLIRTFALLKEKPYTQTTKLINFNSILRKYNAI